MRWSPELTDFVKAHYAEGKSVSLIATAIYEQFHMIISRNAIIGRLHRITPRDTPSLPRITSLRTINVKDSIRTQQNSAPPVKVTSARVANAAKVVGSAKVVKLQPRTSQRQAPTPIKAEIPPPEARFLRIWELPDRYACRWIVEGDPCESASIRYCGAAADWGQAFCPYHRMGATRERVRR